MRERWKVGEEEDRASERADERAIERAGLGREKVGRVRGVRGK
jgi:hypothetical protein